MVWATGGCSEAVSGVHSMDALIFIFGGVASVPFQVSPEFHLAFGAFQVSGLAMVSGWVGFGFGDKTPNSGQKGCFPAISHMADAIFARTNAAFAHTKMTFVRTIATFARTNSIFVRTNAVSALTNATFVRTIAPFAQTNAAFAMAIAAFVRTNPASATANPAFAHASAAWRRLEMTRRQPSSTPLCQPLPAGL